MQTLGNQYWERVVKGECKSRKGKSCFSDVLAFLKRRLVVDLWVSAIFTSKCMRMGAVGWCMAELLLN